MKVQGLKKKKNSKVQLSEYFTDMKLYKLKIHKKITHIFKTIYFSLIKITLFIVTVRK